MFIENRTKAYSIILQPRQNREMTNRDVEVLVHFITRPEMYTHKDEAGYIISFINGYEIGRNGKCDFTSRLSEKLESQFGCKKRAMGWNGQILEYCKKNNLPWESGLKNLV